MSEQLLINACINNNATACQELYKRFSPKMLAVCYRYAKTREDAEDMLQEGFLKIFNCLKQFKFLGSFEGWMRKIIVHTCINSLKQNKKFSDTIEINDDYLVSIKKDYIPSIIQAKQVIDCIRCLPIGYRTVLNLFAIEGYSHGEIAEFLDIKESSSRSQYTRAKILLKAILEKNNVVLANNQNQEIINQLLQAN
jgi:RNA polymerase sigma factor (sigma-70 family)